MKRFSHQFKVNAPLDVVAGFHQDSRALKRLTPPPVFVQMHHVEPLAENSVADFTMWMGPLPVRWIATHKDVDPMRGFRDVQVRGPFTHWEHQHLFESVNERTTVVIDQIQAQFGKGLWGLLSRFMWLNLPFMFAYRGWVTRREVEKAAAAKGPVIK
jgi:ligand-binding SRPBCC domain-containing protein